jgi:hypothetical protein
MLPALEAVFVTMHPLPGAPRGARRPAWARMTAGLLPSAATAAGEQLVSLGASTRAVDHNQELNLTISDVHNILGSCHLLYRGLLSVVE